MGASLNRGSSKQDYESPAEFLEAVIRVWGPLACDLAATLNTAKAPSFISPEIDSLAPSTRWEAYGPGNLWLNPPFGNIAPWAEKCAATAASPDFPPESRILLLVPASVGANWFAEHVHKKALVLGLQGRLTFVGCKDAYPKDCVLAVYGAGLRGFDVWDWRAS